MFVAKAATRMVYNIYSALPFDAVARGSKFALGLGGQNAECSVSGGANKHTFPTRKSNKPGLRNDFFAISITRVCTDYRRFVHRRCTETAVSVS